MCMQCVGSVATAFKAATLVGGPIVAKHYQRVRAVIGLPDNSVAAVEARAMDAEGSATTAPVPAARVRQESRGRTAVGLSGRALPGGALPSGA